MIGSKDKKEEPKDAKHIQSKSTEGETHHNLLPNEPQQIVTDAKTRVSTVEPSVATEIQ